MKGWMKALLWTAGILAVVFGVLRYWFMDFQRIPEDVNDVRNWANAPNLEPGDFALVWRGGTPHTGDLVRCIDPNDNSRWLVARVVALGGEKVETIDGVLAINNFRVRLNACAGDPRKTMSPDGVEVDLPCHSEELGGSKHDIYTANPPMQLAPQVVEAGKMFLLSDNRGDAYANDSRTVGALPVEACQQRLMMRLWSKKGWGDDKRRLTFLF
jgi:signal peptidase I